MILMEANEFSLVTEAPNFEVELEAYVADLNLKEGCGQPKRKSIVVLENSWRLYQLVAGLEGKIEFYTFFG